MAVRIEDNSHPANSKVIGAEVPVREGRVCASCGAPALAGGAELDANVAFCADCARRSRPGPEVELGVGG